MNPARPSHIVADVPFGDRTTLRVGGTAAWGARVHNADMLNETLRWARSQGIPWRIFGAGSNTLVSDQGFDGLLIEWTPNDIRFSEHGRFTEVHADAGANWDKLVSDAVSYGAAGIECLAGIPGTSGAAPIQNIGAYGQEISDVAVSVDAWDTILGTLQTIPARSCAFRYRNSRFKSEDAGRFIITSIRLRLRSNGDPTVAYADLMDRFAERSERPSLQEVRDAVVDIRRAKSMVLDENDSESRSAGSFFMNPIVDANTVTQVAQRAKARGIVDEVPRYTMGPGSWKLPAAWLIERAGVSKGFSLGRAHVSQKHTLALVADENARSSDIVSLARHIRTTVRDVWGVELNPEPGFVGFDGTVHELLKDS